VVREKVRNPRENTDAGDDAGRAGVLNRMNSKRAGSQPARAAVGASVSSRPMPVRETRNRRPEAASASPKVVDPDNDAGDAVVEGGAGPAVGSSNSSSRTNRDRPNKRMAYSSDHAVRIAVLVVTKRRQSGSSQIDSRIPGRVVMIRAGGGANRRLRQAAIAFG